MGDAGPRWSDVAGPAVVVVFLVALLQPAIPNPFQLGSVAGWTACCYAFASLVLLISAARLGWFRPTPFDYLLAAYFVFVLATWWTSVNRLATQIAVVGLFAQVAVFAAIRLIAGNWPAVGRIVVATLVGGIAILEWIAADYHIHHGLSERLLDFAALEWNGREGLGMLAAIQFALLVGIWQQARSRAVQIASMLLIAGSIVEVLFLYSRLPWVAVIAVLAVALMTTVRLGGFRRYLVSIGVIVAVVSLSATPYVVHLAKRAAGLEPGIEGGPELRLELVRNAVTIIRQRVFAGVGLGNYATVHEQIFPIPYHQSGPNMAGPGHPHNIYLQQIAEVGIFGGLAYLGLWASALWAGWRISTRGAANRVAAMSAFYGLVAIAIANIGENMFLETVAADRVRIHTIAWILLAVVIAEWNCPRLPVARYTEHVA